MFNMFRKNYPLVIDDPAGYLKVSGPGSVYRKIRSAYIDENRVPAYVIEEFNGCAVNAAACLLAYASGRDGSFSGSLDLCKKIAQDGYSRLSNGVRDYYTKLGKEAPFVRKCLKAGSFDFRAASSLLVKKRAVKEILAGRPVLFNIAFSRQYRDHTVTAYGFEEYAVGSDGKKVLFFRIRDGYTKEDRYLEYKHIFGISITYLKI